MPQQYEQETFAEAAIIEATAKKPIDKEGILELLKSHSIETAAVENLETPIEDIVPSLRKAKVDLPEDFFKDLASQVELSFLDYSKVKKIYQE